MTADTPNHITTGRWTRFTFLGWLLGVVLILILSSCLDAMGIEHMQFYVGLGMGAGVGFTQWRLLKKHVGISQKWAWATTLGMGIPFIILDVLIPEAPAYKLPVGVALGGIFTGLLQSRLLRGFFPDTAQWVLRSFTGWVLAALSVLIINYTMAIKPTGLYNLLIALLNLLLILSGGGLLGLVTGVAIRKMQN